MHSVFRCNHTLHLPFISVIHFSMKQKIQKLAGLNKEVVDFLKDGKMEEAVAKLAEVQEVTKELEAEAPAETPTPAPAGEAVPAGEVAPTPEEITKMYVEIKKYATLNISAESIAEMMKQFAELSTSITTTVEAVTKRLEVVEQAKAISKQAKEEPEGEKSVW